jgi:hypothetical protein
MGRSELGARDSAVLLREFRERVEEHLIATITLAKLLRRCR